MSKNYYDILDISKDASESDIKKAYHKLALKWHPDKNINNKEEAEIKFKEISEAYDILSTPDKKDVYDKYGENGLKDNAGQFRDNYNSPNDIFKMFFGGNNFFRTQKRKVEPKVVNIPVTTKEFYNGCKKKITIKLKKVCVNCNGLGGINVVICPDCKGIGIKTISRQIGPGMVQQIQTNCNSCNGMKKIANNVCTQCEKNGYTLIEKSFLIIIEKGLLDGDKKIFENMGDENKNAEVGDVIFVLKETINNNIKRIGNDLIINYNISLGESIVGSNITFNDLNDNIISYKEERMIKENMYHKFIEKGMPIKNSNSYGDLYVVYNIKYPNKILSESEKEIIKQIFNIKENKMNENISPSSLYSDFSINNLLNNYKDSSKENQIPHNFDHSFFNFG
jgi:DnaJ-class molecular chaperone